MKKLLLPLLIMVALLAQSCMDPEPGEISVRCFKDGQPQGCVVQLFNADGKQIQEMDTDWNGLRYFKDLMPGTYSVKFIDQQGVNYPATKSVKLVAGASEVLTVELTSPTGDPVK
jgi:hypothetical protein